MTLGIFVRSVYFYLGLVISLLCQLPRFIGVNNKSAEDIHRVAHRWALGNAKRSGGRFHIEGLENIPQNQAVVFISNHQSNFDIAALLAYLPVSHGYIAKIELLKIPILSGWMKHMRCVFIDRKSLRQTAGAIVEGIKILKDGHSMVLFPEGTRSKSETMLEFKAGSFKLATKAGVPIVPVSINGTFRLMEVNGGWIGPADIYVKVHPAIPTVDLEDLAVLPGQVRQIIEEGLKT